MTRALVVLFLMLVLTACAAPPGGADPTATPGQSPGPTSSQLGVNLLVVAGDEVQIKRNGWSQYRPALFGIPLYHGDLLQPATGVQAVVLCADLRTWVVPQGVPSGLANGCTLEVPGSDTWKVGGGNIAPTRAGPANDIPYVISPRSTMVLGEQPLLRWHALPGVDAYKATVMDGDKSLWAQETSANTLLYDGPELEAGETYRLIVEGGGASSEEEGGVGRGFQMLGASQAEEVGAAQARIDTQQLPAAAQALAYAELYAQYELWAEAIATLEDLVQQDNPAWTLYLRLGDLYGQIALPAEARAAYEHALKQAEQIGDLEGQALAALGLAAFAADTDQKKELLDRALEAYEQLGDSERADVLREQLSAIAP